MIDALNIDTVNDALSICKNCEQYKVLILTNYLSHARLIADYISETSTKVAHIYYSSYDCNITFKNGSFIRVNPVYQHMHGCRCHKIIFDTRIKYDVIKNIFAPFLSPYCIKPDSKDIQDVIEVTDEDFLNMLNSTEV